MILHIYVIITYVFSCLNVNYFGNNGWCKLTFRFLNKNDENSQSWWFYVFDHKKLTNNDCKAGGRHWGM